MPILLMSAAHGLRETAQALRSRGVRAVVAKPFDIDAPVAMIRHYARPPD